MFGNIKRICGDCHTDLDRCVWEDGYLTCIGCGLVDPHGISLEDNDPAHAYVFCHPTIRETKTTSKSRDLIEEDILRQLKMDSPVAIVNDACTYYDMTRTQMNIGERCGLVRAACVYTALRSNGNANDYDSFCSRMGVKPEDKAAFATMVGKVEKANPNVASHLPPANGCTCVTAHLDTMIVDKDISTERKTMVRAEALKLFNIMGVDTIMFAKKPEHQAIICILIACYRLKIASEKIKKIKKNAEGKMSIPTVKKYLAVFEAFKK
jgi:transcription initiation factor TFIIIB Brf1 subunit/transcription initiation factor TFIIB